MAAFRFWDGRAWSTHVSRRRRSMRVAKIARVVFIVASVGSGLYLVALIFLVPLLVLNDADNGCLGHDVTHAFLPLVATSCIATVTCVTMAVLGIERRSRWWLLVPAFGVALAIACPYAVPPIAMCT